jgi:hypothetical protein
MRQKKRIVGGFQKISHDNCYKFGTSKGVKENRGSVLRWQEDLSRLLKASREDQSGNDGQAPPVMEHESKAAKGITRWLWICYFGT